VPDPAKAKLALDELTEDAAPLDAKPHAPRYLDASFQNVRNTASAGGR